MQQIPSPMLPQVLVGVECPEISINVLVLLYRGDFDDFFDDDLHQACFLDIQKRIQWLQNSISNGTQYFLLNTAS